MSARRIFDKHIILSLLLSSYPVTLLYASNLVNTNLIMYLIPLLVVYSITAIIYIFLFWLSRRFELKNYEITSSILSICFFTYGLWHSFFNHNRGLFGFLGGHKFLLLLAFIIVLCVFVFVNRLRPKTNAYKFIIIFLIVLNCTPLVSSLIKAFNNNRGNEESVLVHGEDMTEGSYPNIYYLILDGYGSNYSLNTFLNYDNSGFTKALEELGFRVNSSAYSNYNRTIFSLTSTLNLNFIHNLVESRITAQELNTRLCENLVVKILKAHGYAYYMFDSGFGVKDKYSSNEFLIETGNLGFLDKFFSTSDNDVIAAFIDNSILRIFGSNYFMQYAAGNYAYKILKVFSVLPDVARVKQRKFVFAHVICPHPPFLFDEKGNIGIYGTDDLTLHGNLNWDSNLYIAQLKFINLKVVDVVKGILANDKEDKIIIIQGDHGSRTLDQSEVTSMTENWAQEQYGILNAIYISKSDLSKEAIYENWKFSTVNTFRLLFNEYFNYNFPVLRDSIYYADFSEPFKFFEIKYTTK